MDPFFGLLSIFIFNWENMEKQYNSVDVLYFLGFQGQKN